ncbi:MAG: PTS sugar transporter subunit IIB [Clostridium sp.]|jgi:PTS system mannose-specific IIB component|uniref:PTS system mannose/fructose/N-acetylgalactosamine-transporter subunit IIB n=1 Tax=Clostridium sp. TaxID=1506 RepID=UPI0025B9F75D|nr:PTS sugar transporter subunit IIB [Clostridium sp.]MCH3965113.1 PTS sugar transporter subunit IIB [Clostridium sp.]MCI1714334.1 PTS sugar transporter subunit IIB [Clostridium sp.]MCI1798596.1 PTS sugar transporter subunit IIB [Clostridium sp.]MCI1812673.1 PTS sugar transporter subunit IIB [Clostridium sp.]MCI1869405.1 PTS sugar transporter subunit IIB [Clostridium sp.]
MVNIVLTRIDDRLIHGQVMTAWLHYTQGNKIVIVDDGVAGDTFLKSILQVAVPPGVKLDVFDIESGAKFLMGEDNGDRIILLVKTPDTVYRLIQNGVHLKELIIGGMGANVKRKKLYKNISASDEEKDILKQVIQKGVDVRIQIIPEDNAVKVEKFL